MNWGKGIAIGMAAFIVFILTLVTIIMSKHVDLETDNYYQKESNFDAEYQARNQWKNANMILNVISEENGWKISFTHPKQPFEAEILFKHANQESLDKTFRVKDDTIIKVHADSIATGMYKYLFTLKGTNLSMLTEGKYYFKK